jgi:16S rRNA processing protein RimM
MSVRLVGRVVKPHGIRGELVVDVRTDVPEQRFVVGATLQVTYRDGASRELILTAVRPHTDRLLIRFDGVDDRDGADLLRGALLAADPSVLPPIEDPDEFYDHQIEGLAVVTVGGAEVGTVRLVEHGAGGDTLVVDTPAGEALIPFVREIVPEVDIAAGRVVVDPPEGLLP